MTTRKSRGKAVDKQIQAGAAASNEPVQSQGITTGAQVTGLGSRPNTTTGIAQDQPQEHQVLTRAEAELVDKGSTSTVQEC